MKRILFALVLLAACDKTVATPPGTKLVDVPTMTKMSVSDWTVGAFKAPPTKFEKTYHYSGDLGPDVRFKVSFEHGPAELVDAKKPDAPPVEAPRAIRIEVVANTRWAMSGNCEPDLKVPLAVNPDGTSAFPKRVWAHCEVVMKRKNGDITTGPWIDIYGDGTVNVSAIGPNEKIEAE